MPGSIALRITEDAGKAGAGEEQFARKEQEQPKSCSCCSSAARLSSTKPRNDQRRLLQHTATVNPLLARRWRRTA